MAQQTTLIPLAGRTSTLIVDSDLDLGAYVVKCDEVITGKLQAAYVFGTTVMVAPRIETESLDMLSGTIEDVESIRTPYDAAVPWQPGDEASTRDFIPGPHDSTSNTYLHKIVWMIVDYPGMPAESRCRIQCQAIVIGDSASKPVNFRKDGVDIPGGNFIATKSLQTFYVDVDIQHGSSLEVWSHGDSYTICRITNMRMMAVTAVPTVIPV